MSQYSLYDFSESLRQVSLDGATPVAVIKAHGICGDFCEWEGGFVLELSDGRFAYLSGWCDTTGWGCQDGSNIEFAVFVEDLDLPDDKEWDDYPEDLNRWLRNGMPSDEVW